MTNTEGPVYPDDAACAGTDTDLFFPESGRPVRAVMRICAGCEVRVQCLDDALANREPFGVRGGTSERERRRMLGGELIEYVPPSEYVAPVPPKRVHRAIEHGTRRGYQQHNARGVPPCDECLHAEAEHSAMRRAQQRSVA